MKRSILFFLAVLAVAAQLSARTPTSASNSIYPDKTLTPGSVLTVSREELVRAGYSHRARHVSRALERKVLERYGIAWEDRNNYEIDYFIPLAMGGSNSLDNLWPEPIRLNVNGKDLGAITKDRLEDRLIDLVRSGVISLIDAQHAIAEDWVKAYEKYVGPLPDFPLVERLQSGE